MTNWFHDHTGDLRIQMNPRNTSQIVVNGEQDPILNAYSGTPQSPVTTFRSNISRRRTLSLHSSDCYSRL